MNEKLKPATLCVQAGWTPKKGEPRVLPIYQSTTFKYETSDQMARLFDLEESGYFYTRLQNPTNDAVAAKIAALEGGVAAMLTSSGQAANFYAVLNLCSAGDHFVSAATVYGGTFNLFAVTMAKMGIEVTFIDQDASEEEIAAAFRPNTKLLFGETITNPGVEVLDIEKIRTHSTHPRRTADCRQHLRHADQLPPVRVGRRHRDRIRPQNTWTATPRRSAASIVDSGKFRLGSARG